MDSWIIGLILAAAQVAITTAVGFVVTKILTKRANEKEELAKLREEKRQAAEGQRCELVKTTIHEEVVALEDRLNKQSDERYNKLNEQSNERFQKTQEEMALLKDGIQKDLYVDLCNIYDQYKARIKAGGVITRSQKVEYDKLYWTYHNLGKNGVADGMHNEVMKMPEGE